MESFIKPFAKFFSKTSRHGKTTNIKLDKAFLLGALSISTICACAFLFGRATLFNYMSPFGIAFMVVLLKRDKHKMYTLPFAVAGMFSNLSNGYDPWADAITLCICSILFLWLDEEKFSLLTRGIFTVVFAAASKVLYYTASNLLFTYDLFMIVIEVLLILALIFIFNNMFSLLNEKETYTLTKAAGAAVVSASFIGLVIGIGIDNIYGVELMYIGALFITAMLGHKLGIAEGAIAGIIAGLFVMFTQYDSPAIIGILGFAGIAAGSMRSQNKFFSMLCFISVPMCFGLLKGYPELYLSLKEPIIAAALYIIVPDKLYKKFDLMFAKIRQDDTYYEMISKNKIKDELLNYKNIFENLALIYGRNIENQVFTGKSAPSQDTLYEMMKWEKKAENSKALMAFQFKGMAKAVDRLINETCSSEGRQSIKKEKPKLSVEIGYAGYSKFGEVSGDKYLCGEIKDNQYMITLSDGMGKGQKAAEESTLTVNTLYSLLNAGFDVSLALQLINSILLLKSTDEIFSTVDMSLIDLDTGKVKVYKIGAATTFIKRGNQVIDIKVSALPIGIVDKINIDEIEWTAQKGDEIIMMSDGITDADREDIELNWIRETIQTINSKDPQTMADLIIRKAIERYGIKEKDDMTVITAVLN